MPAKSLAVSSWRHLAEWMHADSPADALFLLPPYPGFNAGFTHRSSIIDAHEFGNSVYVQQLIDFELEALRVIYGADLMSMSAEERDVFASNYHCEMEQRYDALLTDIERIIRVRQAYAGLTFVVGLQKGAVPPRRDCGPFTHDKLDLPISYENEMYVVYDVRAILEERGGGL